MSLPEVEAPASTRCYHRHVGTALRYALALALLLEGLGTLLRVAGLVPAAAAYDFATLAIVAVRVLVATVQLAAARLLAYTAPPAVVLARTAFIASPVLLVLEIGFRLAPTSIPPWWRWHVVAGYALYAAVCLVLLAIVSRRDQTIGAAS